MNKQQWELIPLSIKYLGMSATEIDGVLYFRADEVEHQFSKGVTVFGQKEMNHEGLGSRQLPSDTHSGLLLGYQKIEKPKAVSKQEILDALYNLGFTKEQEALIQRIKLHGVENG